MKYDKVERWHPLPGLPERPADIFDLNWQGGELRLIATIWHSSRAGEVDEGASSVLIFNNVFAFQVMDENMELSGVIEDDAVVLKIPYPYGGRWPFLEVFGSDWLAQLAERHVGWDAADFRHLVITTQNMHLHVCCLASAPPTYHSAT